MTAEAPRRRLSGPERREYFIDVTIGLLLETGTPGLTMERVVQRAGVSAGLVYAYFRNVDDLLMAVYEREAGDLLDRLEGHATETAEDFVVALVEAHVAQVRERGAIVWMLRAPLWYRCPDRRDEVRVIEYYTAKRIADFYGVAPGPALVVAGMVSSTIDAMLGAWIWRRARRADAVRLCVAFLTGALPASAAAFG